MLISSNHSPTWEGHFPNEGLPPKRDCPGYWIPEKGPHGGIWLIPLVPPLAVAAFLHPTPSQPSSGEEEALNAGEKEGLKTETGLLDDDEFPARHRVLHAGLRQGIHVLHNDEGGLLQGDDAEVVVIWLAVVERVKPGPHRILMAQAAVLPFPHLQRQEVNTAETRFPTTEAVVLQNTVQQGAPVSHPTTLPRKESCIRGVSEPPQAQRLPPIG